MSRRRKSKVALIALMSLGEVGEGRAEMTYAHQDAVTAITAGFFCLIRPDANGDAVGGAGQVNLFEAPFDFVTEGDQVASQPGIGIGVVARLSPFLSDAVLTARESHGAPCCEIEQSWKTRARPDGSIWIGHMESGAEDFPPGAWRFSLWRGADEVFSYEITVLPADPKALHPCAAPVS